jgi:hypothetical protein
VVGRGRVDFFALDAVLASDRLQQGRPFKAFVDVPTPWRARVVRVHFTSKDGAPPGLSLPRCVLYLGSANGTSVFYDARPNHERTLRLPTAALALEVLPHVRSALGPADAKSPGAVKRASPSCAGPAR